MTDNFYYRFNEINIKVTTNSPGARYYFDEYVLFDRIEKAHDSDIVIEFLESQNLDDFIGQIPENAVLSRSVEDDLNGLRMYNRYARGIAEKWNIAEGMGGVYINLDQSYIRAVYSDKISKVDILPFLLFCNNPLLMIIRRSGFPLLHAACLNVKGKDILITGLSGRGKSTATFSLMRRGHTALTDEATLIKKVGISYAATSMMGWIKVGADAKERFFGDFDASLVRCGQDYIYKTSDINGDSFAKSHSAIKYIFILEQTGIPETVIKKTGTLEVAKEFFPVALSFADKDYIKSAFEVFGELLESVQLRKIYFGTDMDLFVDEIEKEVE